MSNLEIIGSEIDCGVVPSLPYTEKTTLEETDEMYVLDGSTPKKVTQANLLKGVIPKTDITNVKYFDAIGDGITDDTLAIQNAIDYLNSIGGGILYLEAKTYLITYTLIYYSNIKIIGYGTKFDFQPTNSDATLFVPSTYDTTDEYTYNVVFEGFEIKTLTNKGNGIGAPKVDGIIVRNIKTSQLHWHLIDFAGTKNAIVEHCYASGLTTSAIQLDNLSAIGGLWLETSSHTLISAVIDNDISENITVRNCYVEGSGFWC